MDKDELPGVRLCVLKDNDGEQYIKVSIGNAQCVLTLYRAILLFEQLGDTLEMLGVIDDDETEAPRCH
jgi:hypothetical protein